MSDVYIVAACRTPVGSFQGQFEKIPASELGSLVIADVVKRGKLHPDDIQQVIMGQILTSGQGQNPARQASIKAGVPNTVPAYTVNMVCGSGLKSVALGFQAIKNRDYDLIVAGGQENMTRAQHTAYIRGNKMGHLNLQDTLLCDGLTDVFNNIHMGNTAEYLAKEYQVSREEQDSYACQSQNKAETAVKNGWFEKEIVPIQKSGKTIEKDEFPKFGTNVETLAKLKPCFIPHGTVTAGNSSGINDGAAAVLLASKTMIEKKNLQPLAKVLGFAEFGIDPMKMGLGPIGAVTKLLEKINWDKNEVDLYELNEAFAVQSIIVNKTLNINPDKINVTGGAIALGHPIGSSGTRILVTLIYNLQRLGKKKGVAALCIGGGMGIAMAIELC